VLTLAQTAHGQFLVRSVKAPGDIQITDISQAEFLLGSEPTVGSGLFDAVNSVGSGSDADFPGGVSVPGDLGNADDFAVEASAYLGFNRSGTHVFQVNSDAGFRLRFAADEGTTGVVLAEFAGARNSPEDTNSIAFTLPPQSVGFTRISLTYFERTGGEELEFSYSLDGSPQQLVGSTSDLTVFQVPEPSPSSHSSEQV
jgi:hypothetical protein